MDSLVDTIIIKCDSFNVDSKELKKPPFQCLSVELHGIDIDDIIETLGMDDIVDTLGKDELIEAIGIEYIIQKHGLKYEREGLYE